MQLRHESTYMLTLLSSRVSSGKFGDCTLARTNIMSVLKIKMQYYDSIPMEYTVIFNSCKNGNFFL